MNCRLGAVLAAIAAFFVVPANSATTTDGVVLINQGAATAGNVTPGDTAGFPVTLSVGGSYRLASDLKVPPGQIGISVTARNVTIDLNGFALRGATTARGGIYSSAGGLTVRNGVIQYFTQDAIYASGPELRVEDTNLIGNGRYGINEVYVNANPKTGKEDGHAIIKNNILKENFQGITCQAGCHIEGNVISHSAYTAIIINQSGATVIGNTIANNGGYGVIGNYIGLGGNMITFNSYCHTSGIMLVMEKNAIYPASSGAYCSALPGN